jgi:hypothetical protein
MAAERAPRLRPNKPASRSATPIRRQWLNRLRRSCGWLSWATPLATTPCAPCAAAGAYSTMTVVGYGMMTGQ